MLLNWHLTINVNKIRQSGNTVMSTIIVRVVVIVDVVIVVVVARGRLDTNRLPTSCSARPHQCHHLITATL